jgi:putative NADPH-quinone reductase
MVGSGKKILIIQGHPDASTSHLGHALERSYVEGAEAGGHQVRTLDIANLEFPILRSRDDWMSLSPCDDIVRAQTDVTWADHLVMIYPLWLGAMPALLKGFLEQVLRPGFAIEAGGRFGWKRRLRGKSARVIVTMGMPGLAYRWFYRAHSLKSLARNILRFCGIRPVRTTVIGMVENMPEAKRDRWLLRLRSLGRKGT